MTSLNFKKKNIATGLVVLGIFLGFFWLILDINIPHGLSDGILYVTLVLLAFFTSSKKIILQPSEGYG